MDKDLKKGIELIKQVENKSAITFLTKALRNDPNNPEIHRHLGIAFSNLGDQENAISHFQKAVEINPTHHQTWWNLGNIYEMKMQYNKACKAYQEAVNNAENFDPEKAKRYQEWVQKIKSELPD